ncbi:MAG: VOC family protein [Terriglobia bacterium]
MLMRLQYAIVYCSDMRRSIAFYRDQLGFPIKRESPEWTEFHCGPVTLALHLAKPGDAARQAADPPAPGQAQLSFEVLDLNAFFREKKEKGVEFTLPPTPQEFGAKLAVLLDPDGLPISVTEPIR